MVWGSTVPNSSLLMTLNCIAASLSLLGSSLMFYFCKTIPSKGTHLKLICGIAISDLFFSVANLITTFEGTSMNALCATEAFIRTFSMVFTVTCTVSISVLCYKTSFPLNTFHQERFLKQVIGIGAGISIFLLTAPAYLPKIQYTNGSIYCYITYSPGSTKIEMFLVRMMYEGVIIFGGLLISVIKYVQTIRRLKNTPSYILAHMNINLNKLFWYPAVFFIVFIPSIVDNYTAIFTGSDENTVLSAIHLTLTHSIGFANSVLYGLQMKGLRSANEPLEVEDFKTDEPLTSDDKCGLSRSSSGSNDLLKAAYMEI